MVLLGLLRQGLDVDLDAVHVLHVLQQPPCRVHARFAR